MGAVRFGRLPALQYGTSERRVRRTSLVALLRLVFLPETSSQTSPPAPTNAVDLGPHGLWQLWHSMALLKPLQGHTGRRLLRGIG